MDQKNDIGTFNRKVSFCVVTNTKTAMGAPGKTYAHSFYWYMGREQDRSGQEQYIGSRLVVPNRYLYRGNYKAAINETMQLVDDSIKYNIVWVNASVDKLFVEILVEKITE
jgi:hypothetical protein